MAPSRFTAKAVVEEPTSLKRWVNTRLAMNTGLNASAVAARKRSAAGRGSSVLGGTTHATTNDAINST